MLSTSFTELFLANTSLSFFSATASDLPSSTSVLRTSASMTTTHRKEKLKVDTHALDTSRRKTLFNQKHLLTTLILREVGSLPRNQKFFQDILLKMKISQMIGDFQIVVVVDRSGKKGLSTHRRLLIILKSPLPSVNVFQ